MQGIEKNSLFTHVSGEQCVIANGGGTYDAAVYAIVASVLGVNADIIRGTVLRFLMGVDDIITAPNFD